MGPFRFFFQPKRQGELHPRVWWQRLLATAAALVLAAVLYGVLILAPSLRQAAVQGWESRLEAVLQYRRAGLEGWLTAYRADARTVASFPSVVQALAAANAGGAAAPVHLAQVLEQVVADNEFDGLWLLDAAARPAAHYGPADTTALEVVAAGFARELNEGAPPVALVTSPAGVPVLLAGARVRQGDRVVGTVVLHLDPARSFYPVIALQASSTRTGETHLVTQVGDSAVYLSPSRDSPQPLVQRVPITPGSLAARALSTERSSGEVVGFGGVPQVAVTTRVGGTSWALVSHVDTEEVLEQYRDQLQHYALLCFLIIGGVVGLLLLLRSLHLRALRQQQRENEARLQVLASNAGDIIFRYRLLPRIACEYINPAVAGITGFSPEECYADPLLPGRQVLPDDAHEFKALLRGPVSAEPRTFRFYHRDGSERMLELLSFPVRSERGELAAIEGVARDITRVHQQEVALRRIEARHRTLFENLAQGIMYAERGASPTLNAAAEAMLGVTDADLAAGGLGILKAYEEDGTPIAAEALPGNVALSTGRPVPHRVIRIFNQREARFRWVLMGSRPVSSAVAGGTAAVYTTLTDITALREAEDELWGTREMFRALGANSDDLIARINPELRVLTVNPAITRFIDATPDQIIGRNMYEVGVSAAVLDPVAVHIRQVFATGEPRTGGGTLPATGARHTLHFNYQISPEFDREGRVVSVVAWATDVTAQRTLEAQYQQAQKMEAVGRLAGGVAHDFNNLITAIKGYAAFLLEDLPPGSAARTDAAEIDRAADRAARLTRQLLAFSRKQVLELRALRLDVVVRDLESMLRRLIGEDITLALAIEPDLWPVTADPVQLEQVLLNLVVNSRDAMERGGRLEIRLRNRTLGSDSPGFETPPAPGDYVAMTVADSGTGMSAETLEHIFEPFFTTKEVGRGTGLGLPTVYGIVQQSGGAIRVESTPGHGTTFEILLPRASAGAAEEDLLPPLRQRLTAGERILVVEDEPALRSLIRRMLEGAGYQVTIAEAGGEALRLAAIEEPFDLLVTDVVMPGIPGSELAQEFIARFPRARVLFISGYSDDVMEHHGVLTLKADLLQKPFTQSALEDAVRAALDEARAAGGTRAGWEQGS